MATLESWDSWLADQAAPAPKKAAITGEDDKPKHPVEQLDDAMKDEFVKLAAEVAKAQAASQQNKKTGNKGRKRRQRGDQPAVFSESFEAMKQRILNQALEAEKTEAESEEADSGKKLKAKLKRQRKKAEAAKKQKQKQKAASGQNSSSTSAGNVAAEQDDGAAAHDASAAPAGDPMSQTATKYLELWQQRADGQSDSGWKFKKNVQTWLLQHAYYKSQLSGSAFKSYLKYLKGLKGKAAQTTLKQVEALRARYNAAAEAKDSDAAALLLSSDGAGGDKPDKVVKRADKTIAVLQKICDAQASKLRLQSKE